MDDTATDAPAPAPAAELTLTEFLLKKLDDSPTPLTLKELAKGLKRPRGVNADQFEQSLPGYLEEGLRTRRVHQYGSGKAGADRYWSRDENRTIRDAAIAAAANPMTVADLVKKATAETKSDKGFAEGVVRDLIGEERLFEHPPKKKDGPPRFGTEKLPPPPPPKNDPDKVRAALFEAAETPQTLTKLVDAATKTTGADKKFAKGEADKLVEGGQLHKHGTAKSAPYGRNPPKQIHPLDEGKGKKGFEKLVGAARGLLDSVRNVPIAELLDRLRLALADEPPRLSEKEQPVEVTDSVSAIVRAPATTPIAEPPAEALTPERVRTGLKAAYDELCLDPEFEDKLVEIRRLYHEAVRNLRGLTVEQFHRELESLQQQRVVELHALNEVQRAKERELAILRNDRLLYYVIWSKT